MWYYYDPSKDVMEHLFLFSVMGQLVELLVSLFVHAKLCLSRPPSVSSLLLWGVREELKNLSRFVSLIVPLGCASSGTQPQMTLTGCQYSWLLCTDYIGPCHLFNTFSFKLCFIVICTSRVKYIKQPLTITHG